MKCSELIAEKTIDTNFTSPDGLTFGGTVYCVITTSEFVGNTTFDYNGDAVTCIGEFMNFTIPDIIKVIFF